MKMKRLILPLLTAVLFSACASTVSISEDVTSAEIIQRAQEAMDRNRFKAATQLYQILHDRNRDNIDLMITAEYHIAFIQYKQKKYNLARDGFNGVLDYYNSPDEVFLPQHFKRLSQIVLNTIEVKTNPVPRKSKLQERREAREQVAAEIE